MGDKPFQGFPWFSYPAPKFVEKNKVYNELYLRIEKLEERVAELERLTAISLDAIDAKLRLLDDTTRSRT